MIGSLLWFDLSHPHVLARWIISRVRRDTMQSLMFAGWSPQAAPATTEFFQNRPAHIDALFEFKLDPGSLAASLEN
jgi:hypothetical protein